MNKTKALKILKELEKRNSNKKVDLLEGSFEEQKNFILDKSKRKAALCSRRAAKSYSAALMLIYACLENPNVANCYIGLTKETAKNVLIPHIKKIKKIFNLKCRIYKTPTSVVFPNGSSILFFGINDSEEERDKILGQAFKVAVIDECASMTIDLAATIKEYISPTLLDHDGQLVLIGTPGNLRNYFCDVTTNNVPGWSLHYWTADKNPYVAKQYLKEIEELKQLYPNILEDPGFQQHYRGKWTLDTDKKLYKASTANYIESFDKQDYTYILSMDLGWEDQNSFVIGAYHPNDPYLYIVDTFAESKMLLDVTINKINELEKIYPISQYIIDSANKQYVEELRYRTRKPFQAATKPEKLKYIHMMNSDFAMNKIKILEPKCKSLIKEYDSLTKLDDKSENYQVVIGSQPDHCADAALYLWRASFHYMSQPAPVKPPIHSEQKVDEFWDREANRLQNKQEQNFYEKDWD